MNNYPTNSHSREYNISNENLLLIGILNSMYNDNIRQINNLSESIHLLNDTNTEIRNLLTQILYTNTNRRNQFYCLKNYCLKILDNNFIFSGV